jgi:hypothetical protein
MTIQPDVSTYEGDPAINGTMFIAIVDRVYSYTAFNLANINPYVAAGLFLYQAGQAIHLVWNRDGADPNNDVDK